MDKELICQNDYELLWKVERNKADRHGRFPDTYGLQEGASASPTSTEWGIEHAATRHDWDPISHPSTQTSSVYICVDYCRSWLTEAGNSARIEALSQLTVTARSGHGRLSDREDTALHARGETEDGRFRPISENGERS